MRLSNMTRIAVGAAALAAATVSLQAADYVFYLIGDEFRELTNDDNLVYGNAGDDQLFGGGGSDRLSGNAGDDHLEGGSEFDVLSGGVGNDYLVGGDDGDFLAGGTGDDVLRGGPGDDQIYGDEGDYIRFKDLPWTLTYVSDPSAPSYGNVVIEFDGKTYGPDETISGYYGELKTYFNGGSAGNDVLSGGPGADDLHGGEGEDTADYSRAGSGVEVSLRDGQASNDGDGGTDTIEGIENLVGSDYADTLVGDQNANRISGGPGNDTLTGKGGADIFVFAPGDGANVITDYSSADEINLSDGFPSGWRASSKIINGSRVITVDDLTVTLRGYSDNANLR